MTFFTSLQYLYCNHHTHYSYEYTLTHTCTPTVLYTLTQLLGVELNLTVAGVVFKTMYFCQNWELGPHILELGT